MCCGYYASWFEDTQSQVHFWRCDQFVGSLIIDKFSPCWWYSELILVLVFRSFFWSVYEKESTGVGPFSLLSGVGLYHVLGSDISKTWRAHTYTHRHIHNLSLFSESQKEQNLLRRIGFSVLFFFVLSTICRKWRFLRNSVEEWFGKSATRKRFSTSTITGSVRFTSSPSPCMYAWFLKGGVSVLMSDL
jgi:hypothetical protein